MTSVVFVWYIEEMLGHFDILCRTNNSVHNQQNRLHERLVILGHRLHLGTGVLMALRGSLELRCGIQWVLVLGLCDAFGIHT